MKTAPVLEGLSPRPGGVRTGAFDLHVTGIVQGVGFRPFLQRLALRNGLVGSVRNESGAVFAHLEGTPASLATFRRAVEAEAPPLARIESVRWVAGEVRSPASFRVATSEAGGGERLPVPPDVATCASCLSELDDPRDRRHGHAFITCTDCGPRYTLIEAMPYDRERTTMRAYTMCPSCEREYADPGDRRGHSQTNSCPACGPRLWLETLEDGPVPLPRPADVARGNGRMGRGPIADPIREAAERILAGAVVGVLGVGGAHLAVDAASEDAVARLRERKGRDAKPLAVLVASLDVARRLAALDARELRLLESPERPIVLARERPGNGIARAVSPGLDTIGLMLPYSPLHRLLADACGRPIVLTSANRSAEPLVSTPDDARRRLRGIADALLLHDRRIAAPVDDSVARVAGPFEILVRRGRGYAPLPIPSPIVAEVPILAVGAHLKNTFALAIEDRVYPSPHIGDLENLETLDRFERVLDGFRRLFRVEPRAVACDLHPEYLSTRFARDLGIEPRIEVQHHHAHIAAVAAEHGVTEPVLGLAWDGTGLGDDGRVWGAEFLLSEPAGYRRLARLRYAPLPGGDLAARQPWRVAAGYLSLDDATGADAGLAFRDVGARERALVDAQIRGRLMTPEASSMGRLFDAAAAILGVRSTSAYEAQAAMELEALAGDRPAEPLVFPAREEGGLRVLDPVPVLRRLGRAVVRGEAVGRLAATFHESVARMGAHTAARLCREHGLDTVALGGGVFQNARLLVSLAGRLEAEGLRTLVPRRLGPGDGAISYGQAVVAAARLRQQRS